jgi:hypothetical protein
VRSIASPVRAVNPALDSLYGPALGADRDSWLFLIRRVSLLLLSSVSKYPLCVVEALSTHPGRLNVLYSSTTAEAHLKILRSFVTPSSAAPVFGDSSSEFALVMTNHLLSQQLYMKLGHAITQIVCPEVNFSANS